MYQYVFLCHAHNLITIFSTAFCSVTPVKLLLSFNQKGPGGYLIRVDLIRFPGSIPGATQMCTVHTNCVLNIVSGGKCTNYILDVYWVLGVVNNPTSMTSAECNSSLL